MLDIGVPEVVLNRSGILTGIRELEPTGMPKRDRTSTKAESGVIEHDRQNRNGAQSVNFGPIFYANHVRTEQFKD